MNPDWTPLLVAAALGLALRVGGVLLARRLRADHPVVRWAAAVAGATIAAFVVAALVAPPAAVAAAVPPVARAAGVAAGLAAQLRFGLLAGLVAGLGVLSLVAAVFPR
ncbi:hypothetical protein ACQW02_16195 [Humitalea sp. 24SJ18S-53]|uniref:hypothetical protein n=1 Tax=Humitalea sp. 24SJ18S-53 TaxID=3422307 RepID=UPI003D67DD09